MDQREIHMSFLEMHCGTSQCPVYHKGKKQQIPLVCLLGAETD